VVTDFEMSAGLKSLAQALCLMAETKGREGKGSAAIADVILARSLGSRLAAGHTTIVHYLVGISIEGMADQTARRLAGMKTLSEKDLGALQRAVEGKEDLHRLAKTLRTEFDTYVILLAAAPPDDLQGVMPESWSPALKGQPHFDRKDTVARLAAPFLSAIVNSERAWVKRVEVHALAQKELPNPPVEEGKRLTPADVARLRQWLNENPNYVGRQFAAMTASYVASAEEAERRAIARQRLTAATIAVERATRRTGKRPSTIPGPIVRDPFGNGAVRYDARTGRLWSIGPNGKDDGGKIGPGKGTADVAIILPSSPDPWAPIKPTAPKGWPGGG
jgi:hypothetical protein